MAATIHHTRSASFPPQSNPLVVKIDQELKKLQKREASSTSPIETIHIGLSGLAGLYKLCLNNELVFGHQRQDCDHAQLIGAWSQILEISATTRGILAKLREFLGGDAAISSYLSLRKEVARSAKQLGSSLKQQLEPSRLACEETKEELTALRCVSIINISVLEKLLQFLAAPMAKPKRSKSLVSKLMMRKSKGMELLETGNELFDVDVVIHALVFESHMQDEKLGVEHKLRVDALVAGLKGVEDGLSNIETQLTKIKTSLVKKSYY